MRIIRILILIICAGNPLVSHSFNYNWKPKCIDPKIQYNFYFGFQLKSKEFLTKGVPALIIIFVVVVVLYVFHLKTLLMIIIIIIIIIIMSLSYIWSST